MARGNRKNSLFMEARNVILILASFFAKSWSLLYLKLHSSFRREVSLKSFSSYQLRKLTGSLSWAQASIRNAANLFDIGFLIIPLFHTTFARSLIGMNRRSRKTKIPFGEPAVLMVTGKPFWNHFYLTGSWSFPATASFWKNQQSRSCLNRSVQVVTRTAQ